MKAEGEKRRTQRIRQVNVGVDVITAAAATACKLGQSPIPIFRDPTRVEIGDNRPASGRLSPVHLRRRRQIEQSGVESRNIRRSLVQSVIAGAALFQIEEPPNDSQPQRVQSGGIILARCCRCRCCRRRRRFVR